MELPEGYEIIKSIAVEMDPALDGVRRITRRRIPLLRGEGFGRTKNRNNGKEGYARDPWVNGLPGGESQ